MEWYVHRDGQTFGPSDLSELQAAAKAGALRQNDLVYSDRLARWVPAAEIPELWRAIEPSVPPSTGNNGEANNPAVSQDNLKNNAGVTRNRRSNFILAHWRGEVPLAFAYWGFGVLISLASTIISYWFIDTLTHIKVHPSVKSAFIAVFLVIMTIIGVWQIVGIWRSAGRHMQTTGRTFWGGLARCAVVLGSIRAVVEYNTIIVPVFTESVRLAIHGEEIPRYQFRILRDGTEVELSGGMSYGTTDSLKNLLDAAPAVQVVHLNNIGGWIEEGYGVYHLIKSRKLKSYTSTTCVSACAIAFLGGEERLLSTDGKLGFHSSSFGKLDGSSLPEVNTDVRKFLISLGAPEWFVNKAMSTPSYDMWFPTHEELLAANIVTKIVDPKQFGLSGLGNVDLSAIESGILSIPLYAMLKKYDREIYDRLIDRLNKGVLVGRSVLEMQAEIRQVVQSEVVPKYMKIAPSVALKAYWDTQVEEIEILARRDPHLCAGFIFPELMGGGVDLSSYIPSDILGRDLQALALLIEGAAVRPETAKASDAEVAKLMTRVTDKMANSAEILSEPEKYANRPDQLCGAFVTLSKEIRSMNAEAAARILRWMFSQ
jgi:hypothetical protein